MNWFRGMLSSTFGGEQAAGEASADAGRFDWAGPAVLALLPDGTNPIHRLIEQWRLPLRETRAQVVAHVGLSPDPIYRGETILLPEAEALPGAIAPWDALASDHNAPQFPIDSYRAYVSFGDDAHENVHRTASHIGSYLGPAPVGRSHEYLTCAWVCGRARIELTARPPEWQAQEVRNLLMHEAKALRACRVGVSTGAILPLSAQEQGWLASYRPIEWEGVVGLGRRAWVGAEPPSASDMEYARDAASLPPDVGESFGLSGNDEALIVISRQLFIMARQEIMHIEVAREIPGRGSASSTLYAHCRTQAPVTSKAIKVAYSRETDGLNELAEHLGRRLGCPVEIGVAWPAD